MKEGSGVVKWLLLVAGLATPFLWLNAFPLTWPLGWEDILFEGTYLVAALVAYLIVRRLRNTVLEIGFAALTVSLLMDFLDEFTKEPKLWSTMIPNLLEIASMLTIALGLYFSQRRLEGDLDRSQRARAALEESEDSYKDLVEHTEALICTHDLQGRIQSVNQAVVERLGQDRSVLLKSTIRDILAPEARDQFATYLEEIQKRGAARGLMKVMTGAGEVRIWEYHNTLRSEGVPAPIVRGVARDVTEQRRAQEALRKSQQEQQTIFDSAPAMIWYKDKENNILRVNRPAAESIGLPVEELEGRSVYDLYPDEAAQYHEADLQVIQSGGPKLGIVEPLLTASGEKRWIQTDKIPYRDQEGHIIGVIVFAVDISDRMQAEMAVRESEKRYRDLVETSNDLICALDLGGRWTFVNRTAAMRILGYAPEEMLGRRFAEFIPRERLDDAMETFERVKTGAPQIGYETAFLRKDGAPVDMSFNTLALRAPNGKIEGVMCIGTDITERKRLEGELFQAQKLDAIGRLAGGVAHDFNNLLSGIIGFTELTLRELTEGSRGHGYLSRVSGMGRQAADLTNQLLAFARKAPLERRALNLNLTLWEAAGLLKRTLPESLYLQVEASPEPLLVEADLAQIQQVLLNLASNARDAMVQGGGLTLRSARVTFDEQGASAHPERRPGAFARLTVADTGTGIPEAIRDRIFEPFFTTKLPGEGTGLGLASVHGAVHQHEGWIEVETAIGQGTVVHAFLPLLPQPVALAAEPEMEVPRGTETVLLVEDNSMVRELGEVLLTHLGYTVLTASDGVEALVTFQARPGIALVITDAIMPRMGATEMVPGLRRINPGIKVLVITGYTPETIKESLRHLAISGFIQKPFRQVDLAVAVREALDGSLSRIA